MKKKSRKTTKSDLAMDCWTAIVCYFDDMKDFVNLCLSIRGLYNYVVYVNSFSARNIGFVWSKLISTLPNPKLHHVHVLKVDVPKLKFLFGNLNTKQRKSLMQAWKNSDTIENENNFRTISDQVLSKFSDTTVSSDDELLMSKLAISLFRNAVAANRSFHLESLFQRISCLFPSLEKLHLGNDILKNTQDRWGGSIPLIEQCYQRYRRVLTFCSNRLLNLKKIEMVVFNDIKIFKRREMNFDLPALETLDLCCYFSRAMNPEESLRDRGSNFKAITPSELTELALKAYGPLKRLVLENFHLVTDLKSFHTLEVLTLDNSYILNHSISNLKNLEKLEVAGMNNVRILENLPKFHTLFFTYTGRDTVIDETFGFDSGEMGAWNLEVKIQELTNTPNFKVLYIDELDGRETAIPLWMFAALKSQNITLDSIVLGDIDYIEEYLDEDDYLRNNDQAWFSPYCYLSSFPPTQNLTIRGNMWMSNVKISKTNLTDAFRNSIQVLDFDVLDKECRIRFELEIHDFPLLKELVLCGATKISVKNCPNLCSIRLILPQRERIPTINFLEKDFDGTENLPSLVSLDVGKRIWSPWGGSICPEFEPEFENDVFLTNFPSLRRFRIGYAPALFVKNCENLEVLDVTKVEVVTVEQRKESKLHSIRLEKVQKVHFSKVGFLKSLILKKYRLMNFVEFEFARERIELDTLILREIDTVWPKWTKIISKTFQSIKTIALDEDEESYAVDEQTDGQDKDTDEEKSITQILTTGQMRLMKLCKKFVFLRVKEIEKYIEAFDFGKARLELRVEMDIAQRKHLYLGCDDDQ